jgi:hypothetical protein
MIYSDQTYNTWAILTKYKMLADRVNELKTKAWLEVPGTPDIQDSIDEAEAELAELKAWIDFNFETQKLD